MNPARTNRITALLLPALAIVPAWLSLPSHWSVAAGQRAAAQSVAYYATPNSSQPPYAVGNMQSPARPADSPCATAGWPGDDALGDSDNPDDDVSDNCVDLPLHYLSKGFLSRLQASTPEPIYHAPYIDPRLSPPT